ncbi:glycoside hydrolase family 30 protein [Formosa sp. PL04]|uniref:glycoside hydrolase family 30 protein n=1 Tax=Formosa sp. PL04 TaxID=3081755 RepID=UPI0029816A11|nr:glycoside hydrolase family 30 beta sandwich domain-containing protein [Formosa sp. PL04]MDW5288283.1 glycoside hydrolase family 30 beta sandwich domain-containing protein [Formosa sp. PL04]
MINSKRTFKFTFKPAVCAAAFFVFGGLFAQDVDLITTTASSRWETPKRFLKKNKENVTADITIYTDSVLQEVDGIGGAFNELGWDALSSLSKEASDRVFEDLFSKEGANFSMCRIPLGASDYALSYYSSNDVPEDFEMRDFNIDRDRYILIPYIKEALKVNPDLQIWASPWSPPAWMKVNEHYAMRSGNFENAKEGNKMDLGAQILNNATAFKMQEQYLKAYALYFSKFVQAYAEAGVPLFAIMPQNEVAFQPNWPSCTWRAEDMAYFINGFLGPQFESDNLDTEIWLGTVNSGDPDYVKTILEDKKDSNYIKGVGFQWGGAKAIPTVHQTFPNMKLMQTENKCGEQENDWTSVDRSWKDLVHYFNNGAGSYMYWNMILDQTGKSAWGWPQNSIVVIDKKTEAVTYTDEFYLFKHLSHFVQPGDHFLKSSEGANHIAFQLQDGRVVVLVNNTDPTAKTINFKIGEAAFGVEVAATSINTIILNK